MNFNRHIAGLLLICFSAFLGHNLVPHHHHEGILRHADTASCAHDHQSEHEHDQENDHKPSPEQAPWHCHAFNDLVFQKINIPGLSAHHSIVISVLHSGDHLLPDPGTCILPLASAQLKRPCPLPPILGSLALRAPPVFA